MTETAALSRSPREELTFEAVFKAEFGYVWNSLRRLGVRDADLEDCAQEVFLVFLRKLNDYDRQRPLRPWLFGIAYRVASDYRRLARNVRELPDIRSETVADKQQAHKMIEERDLVIAALQKLSEDKRAVLIMHEIDEFDMPEITETLGIPLNTGYSRLRLAREEFSVAVEELNKSRGQR